MPTLISGSLVYDHIMNFPDTFRNHIMPDKIHILNVCFVVDKLERSWGGTAGNIAYTLKLLGGEPVIVSAVGKDGKDYLEHFKKLGVSTEYIRTDESQLTASAYITTDQDDNQVTAFYNGPLGRANDIDFSSLTSKAKIALVSPTQKEVMQKHLREFRRLGFTTVFDPGQQITAFSETELRSMIDDANILVGNDYEISLVEQRTGWTGKEILSHTEMLITTLGEKGSVISTRDGQIIEVGACKPMSFDDPTGAGDAFRAGFFFGYEKGKDLKTCAQIGSVAASYATETYGTQEHAFTIDEFRERYAKTYDENLPPV